MTLKRMKLDPKYGDMFNFLSFHRNLPATLSFMVDGKFACTTIIYGAGQICLHHYHLWGRVNLNAPPLFMLQGKFDYPPSFINDRVSEIEICLHHYH